MEELTKNSRKDFSKLGLAFLIGTIVIYGVQYLTAKVVEMVKPEWLSNPDISIMLSVLPMYLVGMPVLIWLVMRIPATKIEKRRMKPGAFILAAIMSYAIMYLSNIVGSCFTFIISLIKKGAVENVVATMTDSTSLWVIIFYMVICAPIMEEMVFRKLIVDRTVKYGQGVAIVISGLMFGLFHGNLNQFAYAFTLGAFFAFIYVKTGNIKLTIAYHMLINFVGGFISTVLTRALDMEEYTRVFSSGDMNEIMQYATDNAAALAGLLVLVIFVFSMIIAGGILIIVAFATKKFKLEKGEIEIPKGKRFTTVIINVGMILFILFWLVMIVLQLIM